MSNDLNSAEASAPSHNESSLDQKLEEIFDRADDLMINQKNFLEAMSLYAEILKLDPENIDGLNSLAQCIKSNGIANYQDPNSIFQQVYPLYQKALSVDPEDFETNFNLGVLYYEQKKDYERAIHFLKVAINEESNATAIFNLAVIYEERGDRAEAKRAYQEVLKLDPHHYKAKVNLAIILEKEGKGTEAFTHYLEASKENPSESRIFQNMGINMKRAGRLEEALDYYRHASELDPANSVILYNTGILHNIRSEYGDAIESLEASISRNRENVYAYLALGDALERQKENKRAILVYKDLLQLGIKVHGLSEKISYLQGVINQQNKRDQIARDREKEAERVRKAKEKEERIKAEKEAEKKLKDEARRAKIEEDRKLKEKELADRKAKTEAQQAAAKLKKEKLAAEESQRTEAKRVKLEQQREEKRKRDEEAKKQKTSLKSPKQAMVTSPKASEKETSVKQDPAQIQKPIVDKRPIERILSGEALSEKEDQEVSRKTPQQQQELAGTADDQSLQTDPSQHLEGPQEADRGSPSEQPVQEEEKQAPTQEHAPPAETAAFRAVTPQITEQRPPAQIESPTAPEATNIEESINKEQIPDQPPFERQKTPKESQQVKPVETTQADPIQEMTKKEVATAEAHEQEEEAPDVSAERERSQTNLQSQTSLRSEGRKTPSEWLNWTFEECTRKIKSNSKNLHAILRMAQIFLHEKNKPQDAQRELDTVMKWNNAFESAHTRELQGDIILKINENDVGTAMGWYSQSLRHLPNNLNCLIKMGKCYDRKREFQASIQEYQKAINIDPNSANALFRLGWAQVRHDIKNEGLRNMRTATTMEDAPAMAFSKLGEVLMREGGKMNLEEAEKLLLKAMSLESSSDSCACLARCYEKMEQLEKAILYYEKATGFPGSPNINAHFYLGVLMEKQKNYPKAISLLKQCLVLDKNHFGACIHLATVLANQGDHKKAAKYFKHCYSLDHNSIPANFGLGRTLHSLTNNVDEPIKYYEFVIKKDPKHYKALCQLGICHLEKMQVDTAASYLKKCLSINPKHVLGLVTLGNLLFETGHSDHAAKYHQEALKISPKEVQALIGLGNAKYDMAQHPEAISYYMKALEQDDKLADVHYNLGNALYQTNKIDRAIVHYNKAIAQDPNKAESYYNLGNGYCVQDKFELAITNYKKAIELDPYNAPAFYNLGNAYFMLGDNSKAIISYKMALSMTDSPECQFNLASALRDTGNIKEAEFHFKQALKQDPENGEIYYQIGMLNKQKEGHEANEGAKKAFEKCLQCDPKHDKAKKELSSLQ